MSWYSRLYTRVRTLKQRRPCLGAVLSAVLYFPIVLQLLGILFSWFTYAVLTCLLLLENDVQRIVYLTMYHSLLGMALWALFATVCTPVARVPDLYRLDDDAHHRLRAVMLPPDEEKKSPPTLEQLAAQKAILQTEMSARGLQLFEVDTHDRIRYCLDCRVLKPDRAHHCWSCGFCVVKYDHHCPYLNTCISYSNYKFYLLYLLYGGLVTVWALGTSVEVAVRFFWEHRWERLCAHVLVFLSMALYMTVTVFPFALLLCFHCGLVRLNETTCEQVRVPRIRGRTGDYNQGECRNVESVFGECSVLWFCPLRTSPSLAGLRFPITERAPPSPVHSAQP